MCIRQATKLEDSQIRTAYKVMIRVLSKWSDDENATNVESPFRHYPITKNILEGSEKYMAEAPYAQPYVSCSGGYTVDLGYVHSYARLEDAAREIYNFFDKVNSNNNVIMLFECEIPLGPGYEDNECWEGKFDNSEIDTYASRYLIFKREVPREEFESYLTHEA